jgi:hypothetical protein
VIAVAQLGAPLIANLGALPISYFLVVNVAMIMIFFYMLSIYLATLLLLKCCNVFCTFLPTVDKALQCYNSIIFHGFDYVSDEVFSGFFVEVFNEVSIFLCFVVI